MEDPKGSAREHASGTALGHNKYIERRSWTQQCTAVLRIRPRELFQRHAFQGSSTQPALQRILSRGGRKPVFIPFALGSCLSAAGYLMELSHQFLLASSKWSCSDCRSCAFLYIVFGKNNLLYRIIIQGVFEYYHIGQPIPSKPCRPPMSLPTGRKSSITSGS
jgi:hypothetical protein